MDDVLSRYVLSFLIPVNITLIWYADVSENCQF